MAGVAVITAVREVRHRMARTPEDMHQHQPTALRRMRERTVAREEGREGGGGGGGGGALDTGRRTSRTHAIKCHRSNPSSSPDGVLSICLVRPPYLNAGGAFEVGSRSI